MQVSEAGGLSRHDVTLSREDYEELGQTAESPEQFIRQCFEFLLEREPKESILARFDVRQIGNYFPEFRDRIRPR